MKSPERGAYGPGNVSPRGVTRIRIQPPFFKIPLTHPRKETIMTPCNGPWAISGDFILPTLTQGPWEICNLSCITSNSRKPRGPQGSWGFFVG